MSLSYQEFLQYGEKFLSENKGDKWEWRHSSKENLIPSSYLIRGEKLCIKRSNSIVNECKKEINEFEIDTSGMIAQFDDVATHSEERNTSVFFEYHIIYSSSYRVPVLYFNCFDIDGKLLKVEEVWDLIPNHYKLNEWKWSLITQGEHPILGIAYFFIHPCNTAALLNQFISKQTEENKLNYLITWLSVVGPIMHYKLSLDIFGKSKR